MKKHHIPKPPLALDAPLTLADLEAQCCPQCGALLPTPISRLDQIPDQAHLRRAVTVALTGNHSITFIGIGASLPDALAYGRLCRGYGLTAYATTLCVCGNAGNPYGACECAPEAILAWRKRPAFQAALAADLVVEAALASVEQRLAHHRGRRSEPDEALLAQASEARGRPRPSDALDGVSERLLATAIHQLQLTTEQILRVLAVAQSIAQLAGAPAITPAHLAEALQYRSRIAAILDVLEPEDSDSKARHDRPA
jgi:predicted ATPase with chaperone activity